MGRKPGCELTNLIDNYLSSEASTILSCSESEILSKLNSFLHQLKSCESPDMYSKIGNEVLILEHFGFDGSKGKKRGKGTEGFENETLVEDSYQQFEKDNTRYEFIETNNYSQTSSNYFKNLESNYQTHYNKITNYKLNLRDEHIIDDQSKVLTGFFIENKYPPLIGGTNRVEEMDLLFCKQFLDIFELSHNLDFVLFGGIFKQRHRLSFIDKTMIKKYREKEMDLDNINFLHTAEISCAYKGSYTED